MPRDFLVVFRAATEPLVRIFRQETAEKILGFLRQRSRELDLLHEDELEQDVVIAVVERQTATHELVHDDAEAPPVHRSAVVVVFEHFRSEVFRRSAECFRRSAVRDILFAQSEIGDFYVAVFV